MENSLANEVRQKFECADEGLVNLILSGEERINPDFSVENYSCPKCKGDLLEIVETAEGDSERVCFQIHCPSCGCDFVVIEDLVNSCRRGIENALNEIEYNNNKIRYFKNKMEGS